MFEGNSFSKRMLWRYVNLKINRIIHHYHVFSVITILFEEIIKELKQGNEIKIHNLGSLALKDAKPRLYHNVVFNKMMMSKGNRILKFTLVNNIRKKLCSSLTKNKKDLK